MAEPDMFSAFEAGKYEEYKEYKEYKDFKDQPSPVLFVILVFFPSRKSCILTSTVSMPLRIGITPLRS
ncbi:MAG: hypothetical protein V1926_02430 [Candidatus Peregrinibacteria bacterium]